MMWRPIYTLFLLLTLSCGRSRSPQPPRPANSLPSGGLESPAAVEEAPSALAEDQSLVYLEKYLGRYPRSVKLFDTEPLHKRLSELLGNQYTVFLACVQVSSPLKQSEAGIYYLAGRKRNSNDYAYLLIDPILNQMEAGLILEGSLKRFRGPGNEIPVPPEIRMLVEDATFQPE